MAIDQGSRLGPYEVRGPIGSGGMGEVYRARDPRLGRDVAIKVLATTAAVGPDQLRRFEDEARAAAALNHPNILSVLDVGSHDGSPYVVFELLAGETLADRLRSGPVPPRKAVEYAVQVCEGLAAAHAKGIVHRDLKPSNLFVSRDGHVKILDFGLAKLTSVLGDGEAASTIATRTGTQPGLLVGTLAYMSPEQLRGEPADPRSDLFALGATLYEMLAGRPAFLRATPAETISAILRHDPEPIGPSPSGPVPPALEPIVRRCLEKEPEERFQSAKDLGFALRSVFGSTSGAGTSIPPPSRVRNDPGSRHSPLSSLLGGHWRYVVNRQVNRSTGHSRPSHTGPADDLSRSGGRPDVLSRRKPGRVCLVARRAGGPVRPLRQGDRQREAAASHDQSGKVHLSSLVAGRAPDRVCAIGARRQRNLSDSRAGRPPAEAGGCRIHTFPPDGVELVAGWETSGLPRRLRSRLRRTRHCVVGRCQSEHTPAWSAVSGLSVVVCSGLLP